MFRVSVLVAIIFSCLIVDVFAAELEIPRTADVVSVDGVIDEAVWDDALQIDLNYETQPGESTPAPVRTVAYLIEDGEHLYVAFDARDPEPDQIRAFLRDRDKAWNDDFVGLSLDTFNDERRAFEFFANPLGVQMDSIRDETQSDSQDNDSWDAIWDSAGKITDSGYVVEMKIPLDQLRFPLVDGPLTWGIGVFRKYPRDVQVWTENEPNDRDRNCSLCQFVKMRGFEGSRPGNDFEIVPTVTASHSQFTDDPGIVPLSDAITRTEAGVTVRYGITPDLTANLAINPDFSQIEADSLQLDVNNQFALFFPEKRPFFLEGANFFDTPIQAVFTRTIAQPDVGLKLTGKRGNNTMGTYVARDQITNLLFPGSESSDATTLEQENTAMVGRYSRGFGNASSIGGLITVRDGDGYQNAVGGIDARWRINDQHTLTGQILRSETEYPDDVAVEFDQPIGRFDGDAIAVSYEYDSRNWFAEAYHEDRDEKFRADSGFVPKVGGSESEAVLGYVWHGEGADWWTRMRLRNSYKRETRADGQLLEEKYAVRLGIGGPMQSWMQINLFKGKQYDQGTVFDYERIGLYGEFQPFRGMLARLFVSQGDQVDFANNRLGERVLIEPALNWNVTRHLLLDVDGAFAKLDTKEGESIFEAAIVDARLTWQFSIRSFLRFTLQHRDIKRNSSAYVDTVFARSKDVGRQLLYSWKLNPQTVFFLGYSDAYVDDDDLDGLTASDRSIFMKIGYAWSL